jgi:hypothetical protein
MRVLTILLTFLISFASSSNAQVSEADKLFKKGTDAVRAKEYALAVDIFTKLSEKNEYDAQYNLAFLIKSGKGITQNYSEALFWAFCSKLGKIQLAGDLSDDLIDILPEKVTDKVRKEILKHLLKRYKRKEIDVVTQLGDYFLVILEEEDYANAYLWYAVASALNIEGAIEERDKVERKLDSDTLVKMQIEAKKRFKEFRRVQPAPEKNILENKADKEYES